MTTAPTESPTDSALVTGFPFPFVDDHYRYSTNVEPADHTVTTAAGQWGDVVIDVDSEYQAEIDERAAILAVDPSRSALLPHMRPAAWDAMVTIMRELATAYPDEFVLRTAGDHWQWENHKLGVADTFSYGDDTTLPSDPLSYICGQIQEDVVLLDQRDGQLFADAGVVTFAADWSFGFDVGMAFLEIHGPVPRVREEGVITRAHEFIKRLQPHRPYRRTNWTLTIGRRLDVSTERYPEWGPDREMIQHVDDETFGRLVHLRVEVQHLIRLPDSGAVMFLIRTYMLPLETLAAVEPWRRRTAEVVAELPDDMADYKGIIKYRSRAAEWLRAAQVAPAAPEIDERPGEGLPQWPAVPDPVDPGAASFLIVAVGDDPKTGEVAGGWVTAAEPIGPTRLVVLDALSENEDRAALQSALERATTGVRIHLVGGQYDVLTALAVARESGAVAAELSAFVVHTRDLPVYCAQCRDTFRVVGAPGEAAACPGCARTLEVHQHHSAVRGGFLASSAEPGAVS
ncbi:heme-dependent oxidative N-demethylase family protein [Gordonia tangerina]|uniref:DUF3445 domain-containing protein n=1 Tax=Gordonia tangerina TaxID=2911060 RepID=A0ABS9DGA4_9ACTN|nr:DUF3445 domain-containing protein [Gordonia tangerina]MCF3938260.1 DUF3445 domain-containing protein [Gordonia tangerina]